MDKAKEEKPFETNGEEERFKDEIDAKGKELESTKAKMEETKEENQRLRRCLNQITKDYQTLQMQYNDIISQQATNDSKINKANEFVSLSLGRRSSSSEPSKNEKAIDDLLKKEDEKEKKSLSLGLDCKLEMSLKQSPESSSVELVKEDCGEGSLAVEKGSTSTTMRREDDEVSQQNPAKRARVSVRIRCETPTMNDGCQWRKYGQKIAKGNPCPRAYYRCTVAPLCPVRKQVQRCSQDMSILITTYEGTHNHPLSISASAIASTTSAAASMLLSGSSTSSSVATSSSNITSFPQYHHNFHGSNFNLSDMSKLAKPYYISNNSTSSTNPTITLDLTSSSSSSIFNNFGSNNFLSTTPKYPSTNLSFSSLESNNPSPFSWSGTHPYYKNQVGSNSLNFGGQPHINVDQNIYKPNFMQNPNPNPNPTPQTLVADPMIAAATRAITSDPNFQSALVAALSSIIGNRGNSGEANIGNFHSGSSKNNIGQVLSMGESYPGISNLPHASTSTQNGNMLFLQQPLPFATPKSKSTSPSDEDRNS